MQLTENEIFFLYFTFKDNTLTDGFCQVFITFIMDDRPQMETKIFPRYHLQNRNYHDS